MNTHESWQHIVVLCSETIGLYKKLNINYNIVTCNTQPLQTVQGASTTVLSASFLSHNYVIFWAADNVLVYNREGGRVCCFYLTFTTTAVYTISVFL